MASGMARGAAARGKRIAFGDGRQIIWGPWSKEIFKNNPNVAAPGSERARDIEWVRYHKGHRIYNRQQGNKWVWNYDYRAKPGELYFDEAERAVAASIAPGFILIEPNVPPKSVASNKDWGQDRYQAVADRLIAEGHRVAQFSHGQRRLAGVETIQTLTFRHAMAALSRARLAILPEGGLHHGAAALGVPAVVLFGGFIPPEVTGYGMHVNLTGGAQACGSIMPCRHCRAALDAITVDEVLETAQGYLLPAKFETAILQDPNEFNEFLGVVRSEKVRSYLEIGSKHGGSLWRVANAMPVGSRVVAVDLPHGDRSFKESQPHLEACVDELNKRGYDAYVMIGDSTDPQIVADVTKLSPFDLCLIDANHTEPYVRQDWKNYGSLAKIVAFHDIGWIARPEPSKKMPIEVPKVWNEIKSEFHHMEIKRNPRDNGIGILWRS